MTFFLLHYFPLVSSESLVWTCNSLLRFSVCGLECQSRIKHVNSLYRKGRVNKAHSTESAVSAQIKTQSAVCVWVCVCSLGTSRWSGGPPHFPIKRLTTVLTTLMPLWDAEAAWLMQQKRRHWSSKTTSAHSAWCCVLKEMSWSSRTDRN